LNRRARQCALAGLMLLAVLLSPTLCRAREYLQLFVTEPYLELHTGPGRGYPVFHAVPRAESIDVLFRRTDWFKVRTERGVEGWASQADMLKTAYADGTPFKFDLGDRAGFASHLWEFGVMPGQYGGASLISAYTSVSINPHLAVEGSLGQFLGRYSNGVTGDIGFDHVVWPEARCSPLLLIGLGEVHIEPKATLVQPANRNEPTAYVGVGLRFYLSRRFFLRAQYAAHYIFTTRTSNEEVDEWKLGLAFFF